MSSHKSFCTVCTSAKKDLSTSCLVQPGGLWGGTKFFSTENIMADFQPFKWLSMIIITLTHKAVLLTLSLSKSNALSEVSSQGTMRGWERWKTPLGRRELHPPRCFDRRFDNEKVIVCNRMDGLTGTQTPPGGAEPDSIARRVLESFLSRWMGSSQSSSRLSVQFLVCLLIICGATAFVGAVPTRIFGHDDFFLLDNGWRIVCGQRPHLDFFSPWGPVMFLVVGMGLTLANFSVNGIGYGNAIVGLIIGLWAFWLSRGRIASGPRFFLSLYLTLLVTAPYPLGIWPHLSSHACLYNRYGYALLGLVLVECFQRKEGAEQDAGEMLDGISTGAIIAIALFLKASYFAISLLLIAASFLFGRSSIQRFLGLALGFCIVVFAMLAYLRFDIRTVVEAFWMAAAARSKWQKLPPLTLQLISQVPSLLNLIAFLFFGARRTKPAGSWLDDHQWLIWTLLVFSSDSLLMLSNMQLHAMPLLGVFAILIASRVIAERQRLPVAEARTELPRHVFVLVMCALLVMPQLASDLVGLANGVFQKAHPSATTGLVRFTEPHLASLLLYDGAPDKESNGSVYTNYVNDGVTLLRKHCDDSDRVLTMDMVNPFPYALKWRPPRGGIAAIAFNYTLSAQHRPSFDAYFGDATVVLMPKRPAQMRCFIDGFYALYTPALLERYQLCAESDWFWLYKQK
jgi:hypothetical protein